MGSSPTKNVLAKIVEDKKLVVEALKKSLPLESFINDLVPTKKSLYDRLSQPQAGFILECKKASPSKGLIRPDFDVEAIATIYDNYAAGISVLTDEKYFQGTFEYLQQVTAKVKAPVLNKDFFIDTYQVYLARHYGADAVLLMLSVLDDNEYRELAEVAQKYNLAILTEVSNQDELDRALALDAKLIGINNRNLRDLSTDIERTFEFAPQIPDGKLVISESGIYTNEEVRYLAPAVDGFLVGSSIMAQDDVDKACRQLIFGQHKVCGLTDAATATAVKQAGGLYGGLIFAEKSPRYVTQAQAEQIVKAESGLDYVGVFVDAEAQQVAEFAATLGLSAVQLHGNESADYIESLSPLLPASCQVWKAKAVTEQVPPLDLDVNGWVLDGKSPGSGQPFPWQALADTEQALSTCLLAGGIGVDNIGDAIKVTNEQQLKGLDINSGIETSPGKKSPAKINQVFAEIRNY